MGELARPTCRRSRRACRPTSRSASAFGCGAPSAELLASNRRRSVTSSNSFSPTTTCTSTPRTRFRTARSRARWSRNRFTSPTGGPEERTNYTINVADILADIAPEGSVTIDSERPARVQAQCHRPGCGRQLHRARAPRDGASRRARTADRARGYSGDSSRSRDASSRRPTRPSTTSPTTLYSGKSAMALAKAVRMPISEAHIGAAPASRA